jgi:predicted double-glycine peptidase
VVFGGASIRASLMRNTRKTVAASSAPPKHLASSGPVWRRASAPFALICLTLCAALVGASVQWLDVPFVEQAKSGCGSAAIAMVVQYWVRQYPGLDAAAADTERIDRLLPPTSRKGIQGQALKEYLEKRGFQAFVFDGEIADLNHHFEKGRPVIVCFAPAGSRAPLHYAVVVGLDEKNIWLNDPARGKLFREDVSRFLHEWKETGNWALLTVPRQAQ